METTHKIIVVDDDPRICKLLSRYLSREGYSVRTAESGEQMRRLLASESADLVILDLILPGEDGLVLARELRANSDVAIIMLTGKADTVDRIVGLELGADDYVTKPFDERELLARVRTVFRRLSRIPTTTPDAKASVARFAGWELDLNAHELTSTAGDKVHLTSYEFQVLSALVTRSNRALTRDELLDLAVDREWNPFDRSIDVLIGKLRRKIEIDPQHPSLIKTIRGTGYKFTASVELS